jgi:hypothetical protein
LQQHIAFVNRKLDTAIHGLVSRFGWSENPNLAQAILFLQDQLHCRSTAELFSTVRHDVCYTQTTKF